MKVQCLAGVAGALPAAQAVGVMDQHPVQAALPAAIFDLSERTFLKVSGADRLRYLNGQLTQDLKRLGPERALPACVTSAKGRMQAEVWVSLQSDAIVLDAAPELRETLPARIERYIVADDVQVEDCTGGMHLLHAIGGGGGQAVLAGFPRKSASRLGAEGVDIWVPTGEWEGVKRALAQEWGSAKDWERLRVRQGIPAWGAELGEETLPPEAGLERTHIDYHKGCYIGQEVISRLKSVGHVNRVLTRFHGTGAALPAHDSELLPADGAQGGAGRLTSVVTDGAGGFFALGYLKRGVQGALFTTANGTVLTRLE